MRSITCAELHDNTEEFLDLVESGEVVQIVRQGHIIATVEPVNLATRVAEQSSSATEPKHRARWRNRPPPIQLSRPNALSDALAAERAEDDR